MPGSAITSDDILIPRGQDNYMEVRHIVLEGPNRHIGKALGDVARESYGVTRLMPYASPVYARAHREYAEQNYPILFERMKGVGESYDLPENDLSCNTSSLLYCMGPPGCSAVYFPGSVTTTGHPLAGRASDFYTARFSEFAGLGPDPNSPFMFSRSFVVELYPDQGYPSLVLGGLDLMNGLMDGINSEGLGVTYLADNSVNSAAIRDLTRPAGISDEQLARLLLDTCATVDEARVAILKSKFFMLFDGSHLMVSDAGGDSTIAELSEKDFSIHFTDNDGRPQVMTNHSVWEYPDESAFPDIPEGARYDSFFRYKELSRYVSEHPEGISSDDVREALSLVYANTTDSSEGAALDLPVRTLWPAVFDYGKRSISVKFYLKDGPGTLPGGGPELVFSEPMEFRLRSDV